MFEWSWQRSAQKERVTAQVCEQIQKIVDKYVEVNALLLKQYNKLLVVKLSV